MLLIAQFLRKLFFKHYICNIYDPLAETLIIMILPTGSVIVI